MVYKGLAAYQRSQDHEFAFTSRQLVILVSSLSLAGLLTFFFGVSVGARLILSEVEASEPVTVGVSSSELETISIQPLGEVAAGEDTEGLQEARQVGATTSEPPEAAREELRKGLVAGGRLSVAWAPAYDASYAHGGDPGPERGTSVDLVVRAFRHVGIDVQERVHADILRDPGAYGISTPDWHIDHRRIGSLVSFFLRHAKSLPIEEANDWMPGDLVVWRIGGVKTRLHLGIVSDRQGAKGDPLVFHHKKPDEQFDGRPGEDDVLYEWPILYHLRWPAVQEWAES